MTLQRTRGVPNVEGTHVASQWVVRGLGLEWVNLGHHERILRPFRSVR